MPETLRDLAGLPSQPAALSDAALMLIDCQNAYREGAMQLSGAEDALPEAACLLVRARNAAIPVFHIQRGGGPGSLYDTREKIGQISDAVAPRGSEPVIIKHFPNAFFQTELDRHLRMNGVSNAILAGFMTHMCVNSTARGAFNLGFRPTIVATATATRDLPGPDGQVVSARVLQAVSLAALNDLFAIVVRSSDQLS